VTLAETVSGLNIKLSLDGRDLENELKEINKDLKGQQKDLQAINQKLKYDSSNVTLWRDKQAKLNDVLEATRKKLDTQNQELIKAKEAVKIGKMSEDEYRKLQRNVAYTEAEVSKLNHQLNDTKKKIVDLGNANFKNIEKLGGTLTKSITLPVLGAISALTALSIKSATTADEIGDTAQKLGLTAEQLQEWNYVAQISGSSTESLSKAFIRVNGILGDIATGNGDKFADSLALIGLTVDDLKGKNADQAFELIRSSLAKVEDASLRVGLANEFFGEKIGTEILPVLSSETEAILNLRNEAQSLGIVTNEQAQIAGQFTDALDQTKQALSSLAIDISIQVLPILQSLLKKVREEIIPVIKNWVQWWADLDSGTKTIILTIGGLLTALGPVLTLIGKVGPILNIASTALRSIGSSGFFAGAGLNFATLGIGALIALIAIALFESEEFRALLTQLGETLIQLLPPIMAVVDSLVTALTPVMEALIELVVMLVDALVPIIEALLPPLIPIIMLIADVLTMLAPLIEVIGNVLSAILIPAIKVLKAVLEPILMIVQKIIEFLSKVFEWIGDLPSKVGEVAGLVGKVAGNVADNVGNFVSGIADGVGDFVGNAVNAVGGVFGKIGGFFGNAFNLKQNQSNQTNNTSSNTATTNNITINTTSPTFDIDSINRALGGSV
jgi:hypothetical protein